MDSERQQQQQQQQEHIHYSRRSSEQGVYSRRFGAERTRNPISPLPDRISVPNSSSRQYTRDHHCRNRSQSSHNSLQSPRKTAPAPAPASTDIIELLFTKLLDALIFTSAIAITAYSYWTGTLRNNPQTNTAITAGPEPSLSSSSTVFTTDIRQWRQTYASKLPNTDSSGNDAVNAASKHSLEDSRRRRTMLWAETMAKATSSLAEQQQQQQHEHNAGLYHNEDPTSLLTPPLTPASEHPKRRKFSVPAPLKIDAISNTSAVAAKDSAQAAQQQQKEDEMIARMEERLQSLIEEGQAALSSKVELYDLDENEITMRRAFASGTKTHNLTYGRNRNEIDHLF